MKDGTLPSVLRGIFAPWSKDDHYTAPGRAPYSHHQIIGMMDDHLKKQRSAVYTNKERFFSSLDDVDVMQSRKRLMTKYKPVTEKQLRQHDRADWRGVDRRIAFFAAKLIIQMCKENIPLYVHCARRTPEEQLKLYNKGVSGIKGPYAPHTMGYAVDIVHSDYHWEMTENEWKYIGIQGKKLAEKLQIEITWGGDWKHPWDPAHWQLKDMSEKYLISAEGEPCRLTPHAIIKEILGY